MGYFNSPYHEIVVALGLVLLAMAAPSHIKARNTGTMLYIFWVFLANLLVLINRIIWNDHVRNIAPVWCDISAKLLVGVHFAIGAASIVINRRLFKISRISSVMVTPAQKRKELTIELLIGLGIPAVGMCVHYVVQGHRGNIIQGIGCWPTVYLTAPTFPLFAMWPCVLSLIAIVYGILSLRAFLKRRIMVEEFLNSHASGLNADRYFRLMCFSAVELTIAFPLGLYQLLTDAVNKPISPWISWDDTHLNFDRYDQIPAIFFEASPILSLQFTVYIWSLPFLAYIFFLFFGLGAEQINQYKRWFYALLRPLGIKPPAPNPYNPDRRTWWQKLLRRPAHVSHGTGLTSSRGAPTDSLPVFRHDLSNNASYPEKPIPSARSRVAHTSSLDATLTFEYDDKLDIESNISGANHVSEHHLHYHPEGMLDVDKNKALPASPAIVVTSLTVPRPGDGHGDGEGDGSRTRLTSLMSTSSASSVAGSSRRVSAAIRDVELSDSEVRAMEARVQHIA